MKKIVLILFSTLLFFAGCESTKIEEKGTDSFITKYDDIEDISYFTHKELEIGYFYNLKDSISGERENISMYIADTNLIVTADYQYKDWMFIDGLVFLDDKGNRLSIKYGERTSSDIKSGYNNVYIREHYGAILKNDDIELLTTILQSGKVNVAFLGKTNTNKMELKEKYKKAMLDTIKKFKSL